MKVGAENRKKLVAAMVLMVLAALSLYTLLSRPSATAVPAAAAANAQRQPARGGTRGAPAPDRNLDPTLHLGLLRASEGVKYEGNGRNIFRAHADEPLPKPIVPPLKKDQQEAQKGPPQPPPPPPINLKFYGFANKPGDPSKKVFLSEGDNIFIASEGDVVNRRYKVVRIGQSSVEIQDLLNNNTQTIPLSQS